MKEDTVYSIINKDYSDKIAILTFMKKLPEYGIVDFSQGKEHVYFYSNDLKTHLESHQFVNSPHRHSTYIAILFTKGTGKHQIDFDTYQVRPGKVFLLSPGQVHNWTLSKNASGFVFFHTREFYDSIFLKRKVEDYPFFSFHQNYTPAIEVPSNVLPKVEKLFREINDEFKSDNHYKTAKLESLTDLVYIELARLYYKKGITDFHLNVNYQKVKKLQKLIHENFKVKKYPKEYAEMMNISVRHLSRIVNDVLNRSTTSLITERVILEAKRILVYGNPSVTSIAHELGYDDYSYFIRLFKKQVGMSPKEFQKRGILS